jgi:AraC-like DNA-binding protein
MPFSEVAHEFDDARPSLAPYGLTCVRWRARPMTRPDRHNEIELNLLESGSVTYLLGGKRVTVRAGGLAAFWAIVPHRIVELEGDAPYLVATVPLKAFLRWPLPADFTARILGGELIQERAEHASTLDVLQMEQWREDLEAGGAERAELVLLGVQGRLRRMAVANATHAPLAAPAREAEEANKAERMASFVAENFQRTVRVEDVSTTVGLHPDYATALFNRVFGMTIRAYILEHRISQAQRLLSTTRERVAHVAFGSGFDSLSRFNAAFRESVGCTPREYRARHGAAG